MYFISGTLHGILSVIVSWLYSEFVSYRNMTSIKNCQRCSIKEMKKNMIVE